MSVTCSEQFARRLIIDINPNLTEREINEIICGLKISINAFDTTKPTTSLAIIADNLYACLQPSANEIATITSEELSSTLILIVIITAMFIVFTVILIIIMSNTVNNYYTIGLAILFAIFYIGIVLLLSLQAKDNISNTVLSRQTTITNCINTALTDLTNFENGQNAAINNALCAYPEEPPALPCQF